MVNKLATSMMAGQIRKIYSERPHELGIFPLRRRRTPDGLTEASPAAKVIWGINFEELYILIPVSGTRVHSLELQRKLRRLQVKAKYFTNGMAPLRNTARKCG